MMRIDYIRIPGREWISDPDRRFDTVEIRAPLLIAARRAIAAVGDDLPASFRLPEGATIRSDETVLPIRVLREAIVNAVMHRSYRIHGPIRDPALREPARGAEPGSFAEGRGTARRARSTRNPRVAAVLHEVHLAETKGSGIRAMRELMLQHDLLPPTFESSRRPDQFVATFLFHHFLGEADLKWLRSVTTERLSDEEARALVFVREAGAIDNAAYRAINRTDTLQASVHLRRLRDLQIMEMKGAGNRTYYVPNHWPDLKMEADPHQVTGDPHQPGPDPHQVTADPHQVAGDPRQPGPAPRQAELEDSALPGDLAARVAEAGPRPRRDKSRAHPRPLRLATPVCTGPGPLLEQSGSKGARAHASHPHGRDRRAGPHDSRDGQPPRPEVQAAGAFMSGSDAQMVRPRRTPGDSLPGPVLPLPMGGGLRRSAR